MKQISSVQIRQVFLWTLIIISLAFYSCLELTSRLLISTTDNVPLKCISENELYIRGIMWLLLSVVTILMIFFEEKWRKVLNIIVSLLLFFYESVKLITGIQIGEEFEIIVSSFIIGILILIILLSLKNE